jgi:cell shape-determining protein MreD
MPQHRKIIYIIPYIFIFFFLIFEASYKSLLYFGSVTPLYEYTVIFYWCLFLPRSLPFWVIFVIGIIRDAVLLSPIGLSSVAFVLLKWLIDKQHSKGSSFFLIWIVYIIDITIVMLVQFVLLNIGFNFSYNFMNIIELFIKKWGVTCMLYPLMHFIFFVCRNTLIYSKSDVLS